MTKKVEGSKSGNSPSVDLTNADQPANPNPVLPRLEVDPKDQAAIQGEYRRLTSSAPGQPSVGNISRQNRFAAADVRSVQQLMEESLGERRILDAALGRIGKGRDRLMRDLEDRRRALVARAKAVPVAGSDSATSFARRPVEHEILRNRIIPELEKNRDQIVIADVGPGFFPNVVDQGEVSLATYEPYLLASLSEKAKVKIYDLGPEAGEIIRNSDGKVYILALWEAIGLIDVGPNFANTLRGVWGDQWRDYLDEVRDFFKGFYGQGHFKILKSGWMGPRLEQEFYHYVQFSKPIRDRIESPYRTVDIAVDPISSDHDIIVYHLQGPYLGLQDMTSAFMALIRIISRLREGGYLVTEPFLYSFKNYKTIFPHAPPPELLDILGLEVISEENGSIYGKTPSVIYRKQGPTNELIAQLHHRIETVLGQAHSLTSHNTYRYPAYEPGNRYRYDRSMPATLANVKAPEAVWRSELMPEKLAEITRREETVSERDARNITLRRQDPQEDSDFSASPEDDIAFQEAVSGILARQTKAPKPFRAASFGLSLYPKSGRYRPSAFPGVDIQHLTVDPGTKLLPEGMEKLHMASFRKVACFLHPVLQRSAFIQIVNQLEVDGLLISDYLLTEAEASLLGLEHVIIGRIKGENPKHERDRFVYGYAKKADKPFVREMMEAIRAGQVLADPKPQALPVEAGGGVSNPTAADSGQSDRMAGDSISRDIIPSRPGTDGNESGPIEMRSLNSTRAITAVGVGNTALQVEAEQQMELRLVTRPAHRQLTDGLRSRRRMKRGLRTAHRRSDCRNATFKRSASRRRAASRSLVRNTRLRASR